MTGHPFAAALFVLASIVGLFGIVRLLQRRFSPSAECTRKLMHVGSGLLALALPCCFDRAEPVLLLAAITFAGLLALRRLPSLRGLSSVISNVERRSVGELCIPLSTAFLFVATGHDFLMYSIPLLAMTFADSAAALVGHRFGTIRFAGGRTLEGSLTFFAVSFLSADIPLCAFAAFGKVETMLFALLFALLLTAIEAACGIGLDNLFVPVGAFVMLRLFVTMSATQLALQVALTLSVLALAFVARVRPEPRGRLIH
ncbi:MAG TPA: hypothetical protein VFM10_12115 [Terriglobales bacterium]|nr:hypothetical protein [Terriglobales bacterium]